MSQNRQAEVNAAQAELDFERNKYQIELDTSHGKITLDMHTETAPGHCKNMLGLAKIGYYDGLTFHRLIHNFMIQGGSPNGFGSDGPGFSIQDEFDGSLRHSGPYKLSMAKSALPGSGGSQFFITLASPTHLDDKHSVFGEVISGTQIIDNRSINGTFVNNKRLTPYLPHPLKSGDELQLGKLIIEVHF